MFGHLPELLIILVIALIVFGPEKLPEVAANAGKMMREVRQVVDLAMNPQDHIPDDFSTYYYESLARAGEDVPPVEEPYHSSEGEDENEEAYVLRPDQTEPELEAESPILETDYAVRIDDNPAEGHVYPTAPNGSHPDSSPASEK